MRSMEEAHLRLGETLWGCSLRQDLRDRRVKRNTYSNRSEQMERSPLAEAATGPASCDG